MPVQMFLLPAFHSEESKYFRIRCEPDYPEGETTTRKALLAQAIPLTKFVKHTQSSWAEANTTNATDKERH